MTKKVGSSRLSLTSSTWLQVVRIKDKIHRSCGFMCWSSEKISHPDFLETLPTFP